MHTIRLRSAWQSSADGKTHIRRFHRPTGLHGARVWLVIEGPLAEASLNGTPLTWEGNPPRCEVTTQLLSTSELLLRTDDTTQLVSARLEIVAEDSPTDGE